MKFFIAVLALAALAHAAPEAAPAAGRVIAILSQRSDVQRDKYQYSYETENGIAAQEQGVLKPAANPEGAAIAAQGQYAYIDQQGNQFAVQYLADENGYQPQGAHLPIAPPIPEAIQRALVYIAAHPPPPQPLSRQ